MTVPTPIDKFKKPDLSQLKNATKQISEILKINDIDGILDPFGFDFGPLYA